MPTAPSIATIPGLPAGRVGVRYSATLVADGDPEPTWTADVLPDGLTLTTAGVLSGTPTTAGTTDVLFTATNTEDTATLLASITVAAADLVTLADLESYLQQGFPDGDTSGQDAADYACAVVKAWCRRSLVPVDGDTYTYGPINGTARNVYRVELPYSPVRSVSAITVDDVSSISDWILTADDSLRWVGTGAPPTTEQVIVVTYDHGYVEGDFRLDTARAVALRLAARLYQNPLDRGTFSGPEGLQYSPSAGVAARLLTGDEQMMLAVVRDQRGFA